MLSNHSDMMLSTFDESTGRNSQSIAETHLNEQIIANFDNGFLMIPNELMDAQCLVHLSDRESRLFHAVMRKTYGFNKAFDWIGNDQMTELTGIRATHISTVKKSLFDRLILIKRGRKIGINPVLSDWILSKKRTKTLVQETTKNNLNRRVKKPKQENKLPKQVKKITQTGNHNIRDNITNTLTKDKGSKAKSLSHKISFDTLPYDISIETAEAFIEHRKLLKAPLTQRAFDLSMEEAGKAPSIGLTPEQAIDETIVAGWKGVKIAWLENRGQSTSVTNRVGFNHLGLDDTSWADNLGQ